VRRISICCSSIREIVNADDHVELTPFVQQLWDQVMDASQTQTNRLLGAECIGRLAIVDPSSFLPQLRGPLENHAHNVSLRSLSLSALRTIVTSDSSAANTPTVTKALKPLLKAVLDLIPTENDLSNRRVGLTIVNAAMHSRFDGVILPLISHVISVILKETKVRSELIKEVQMGPFKHKVDDGLECRKVSYNIIPNLSLQ
jgi:cullin-associated NEDD8-dissociated protein 1